MCNREGKGNFSPPSTTSLSVTYYQHHPNPLLLYSTLQLLIHPCLAECLSHPSFVQCLPHLSLGECLPSAHTPPCASTRVPRSPWMGNLRMCSY